MILTTATAGAQTLPQAPEFLKKGDKVVIMSPASTPVKAKVDGAAQTLRDWGFKVEVSKMTLNRHHMYAGHPDARTEEFLKYLRDPEVKAIISSRGGYGSSQLLARITPDTLAKYPKWIVGYSDISALHSAQLCAGNMSLHACMAAALCNGTDDQINLYLKNALMGHLPTYSVPGHKYNQSGTASGILMGGNLAVLSKIAGSKDFDCLDRDNLEGKDIILFLEDVGESFERVNAMLDQLYIKGVMKHVKGVIIGRFTDYKPRWDYKDMNDMIHDTFTDMGLDVPVCYDFPVSHDESWNYPMIEGHPVTLAVDKDGVTLSFVCD
ncbi:MAG: LD-carboxypeptidase [Bacteroidales bacterium]|nr:LD-carboxypeptidase [Candidatus Sodaliphilus limicaballi]